MKKKNLQAYILPKNDEFMNTNLPEHKDRLQSLTNFTGSNGYTIITADETEKAQFVTDSRYEI